ncbi:MAG: hypothetical protein U0457_01620 [Candidatus Sericytochromatia bacterium]
MSLKSKKMFVSFALGISYIFFANNVKAEENKVNSIERFSIEAGGGLNLVLPFAHAKIGYILPTEKNNLQVIGEYSFLNLGMSLTQFQSFYLGVNYYLNEKQFFNPFISASIMSGFHLEGTDIRNPNVKINSSYKGETLFAGIGSDFMLNKNIGISTLINFALVSREVDLNRFSYINGIRPEVNLKVCF